jgi:hypothetical protein
MAQRCVYMCECYKNNPSCHPSQRHDNGTTGTSVTLHMYMQASFPENLLPHSTGMPKLRTHSSHYQLNSKKRTYCPTLAPTSTALLTATIANLKGLLANIGSRLVENGVGMQLPALCCSTVQLAAGHEYMHSACTLLSSAYPPLRAIP